MRREAKRSYESSGWALAYPFDNNPEAKEDAKTAWNTGEPDTWASNQAEVEKNLAIYDGFDTVCGTQILVGGRGERDGDPAQPGLRRADPFV
jgi:hypothetical protein